MRLVPCKTFSTSPMSCDCFHFQPIELDRESITQRIEVSPAIRRRLTLVAEHNDFELSLFHCSECGQLWQDGREWNFGYVQYLFQVPPIDINEWQKEPYAQPAAIMIYSEVMKSYVARMSFELGNAQCRAVNCTERALRFSVLCRDHHIESLQLRGQLPKKPIGRMFAPYHFEEHAQ